MRKLNEHISHRIEMDEKVDEEVERVVKKLSGLPPAVFSPEEKPLSCNDTLQVKSFFNPTLVGRFETAQMHGTMFVRACKNTVAHSTFGDKIHISVDEKFFAGGVRCLSASAVFCRQSFLFLEGYQPR